MKETKLLTKRKNKTYLQILNDEKKYYKKKSKWKKIILNLLFLILYTILVIFIYSLFTKKKKSSSESDITNIQSYPNDADEEVILKNLTNNDEVLYQKVKNCLDKDPDEQMCIYHLLCPKEVVGKNRVLAGPNQEGGTYVMLDDFDDIKICYSLGIDHNVDFDDRNPTDIINYTFEMLEQEYDIVMPMDQANEFLRYLMDLANSTRLWINNGHTPNELHELSGPFNGPTTIVPGSSNAAKLLGEAAPQIEGMGFNVDLDSNAAEIPTFTYKQGINGPVTKTVKKVYPNDPCPCGSGKKYKKCCGKNK